MSTSQPTLKDIAEKLGLGLSTVSMAMNNHPSLAVATRQRVQDMAESMGYRRNPAFSAVGSRARWSKATRDGTPLVLVYEHLNREANRGMFDDVLNGMRSSGKRLGYTVEEVVVKHAKDWDVLPRQFRARGVAGVIFGQLFNPDVLQHPGWRYFILLSFGLQTQHLPLHTVRSCRYRMALETVRYLIKSGHRRIGWIHARHTDFIAEEDLDRWAGVMAGLHEAGLSPNDQIPVFEHKVTEYPVKKINAWIRTHRPTVILSTLAWPIYLRLLDQGWKIPGDFHFACLLGTMPSAYCMGMRYEAIGERTVEWADTLLRQGEFGLPETPREALVAAEWHEPKPE